MTLPVNGSLVEEVVGGNVLLAVWLVVLFVVRMANLSYIRNFCFSHSSKDELSYCLSTFEAAVEYINLGKLQDTRTVSHTHTFTQWFLSSVLMVSSMLSRFHQGSGELNDKTLFKERMSLLSQSVATPIHRLFEVSSGN